MSILLDVTGKLPSGLVEMYRAVSDSSDGLPFLIVGAMARDLVLHHGFGAPIERGTRDVDFAIRVASDSVTSHEYSSASANPSIDIATSLSGGQAISPLSSSISPNGSMSISHSNSSESVNRKR